jgi:hypothetical protein
MSNIKQRAAFAKEAKTVKISKSGKKKLVPTNKGPKKMKM